MARSHSSSDLKLPRYDFQLVEQEEIWNLRIYKDILTFLRGYVVDERSSKKMSGCNAVYSGKQHLPRRHLNEQIGQEIKVENEQYWK